MSPPNCSLELWSPEEVCQRLRQQISRLVFVGDSFVLAIRLGILADCDRDYKRGATTGECYYNRQFEEKECRSLTPESSASRNGELAVELVYGADPQPPPPAAGSRIHMGDWNILWHPRTVGRSWVSTLLPTRRRTFSPTAAPTRRLLRHCWRALPHCRAKAFNDYQNTQRAKQFEEESIHVFRTAPDKVRN